jgi:hypothetical protein
MDNLDVISAAYCPEMKECDTLAIYNSMSTHLSHDSPEEVKESVNFINELKTVNDYLIKIAKGG